MEAEYDISGNKQNKSEAGSNVHLRKYVTLAETASEPKNLIDIIRQVILKFILVIVVNFLIFIGFRITFNLCFR